MRSSSTSSSHATSSGSAARGDGAYSESLQRSQQMPVSEGMPDRRASQGSMAPRSQFSGGNSAFHTASGAPRLPYSAPVSATPQSSGEAAAGSFAAGGASRGSWRESLRGASSTGSPAMPTPLASGAGQGYGGAASGSENPGGSWTQSLRQPTSGEPSGRPGGGTSAPVRNTSDEIENWDWDWERELEPVRSSHPSSGPQSAADPGPAASAGSRPSPSLWRSSISPQQRYSQADTLDAHESAVRDRDDPYHSEFWEDGVCSGVAATWMVDRVLHPDSSSADRISRLSSEQGLRTTLSTHQKGRSAHLLGSLDFLGGSAMNGERASISAMLEPARMTPDGEPSEFRLSRGDVRSIASTISAPGHSMINIQEIQSRQNPDFVAGHMLSAYSDGSRIELFDGNRGEFHADVSEAGTLLKDVLGYYSGAYEMDKVLVHRLTPSEAGSGSGP